MRRRGMSIRGRETSVRGERGTSEGRHLSITGCQGRCQLGKIGDIS